MGAVSDYLAFPFRSNPFSSCSQFTNQADSTFDDAYFSYAGLPVVAQSWYDARFGTRDYRTSMYDTLIKTYLARAPQDGEFQTLASAGSLSQAEQMTVTVTNILSAKLFTINLRIDCQKPTGTDSG